MFCQVGTAFASRADHASLREIGLGTNRLLLAGCVFELLFAAVIVYAPPLQHVFGTAPPPAWLYPVMAFFPVLVWAVDEFYRWAVRRRESRT